MATEKIIGIDLGTSNSQAAVMMGGRPTIIPSAEGATVAGKMFPSVVAFTKDGNILVGEPAKRQAVQNPKGTVMAAKRKMGSDFKYEIYGKEYTPQQIGGFLLQKIKKDAEAFIGEKVHKAVITVPAYFNDNQRQATKDAGKIAGLEVVRIINEPTAAALSYGLDKETEQKIMVFDLGGGTLDVTILEFGGGIFEVKSTSGDTQLGGTDMDARIIKWICEEFKKQSGINLSNDDVALQRIREAAEKAKIELSTVLSTEINLPYITADSQGPKHLNLTLSRAKLEEMISDIVERCKKPMMQAITDAKLTKEDIKRVILVGGPTRMPVIQKLVEDIMGNKVEKTVDPMECVAAGASIQGGVLAGEVTDLLLLDVTPLTLGIETLGGVCTALIPRNTTIPTKKSQTFSTAADMQTAVTIHVLQGERPMVADNTSLGQFNLVGIAPAPRGVPQIEVTFDIDANGIINVSAKDLGTSKEHKITITASSKMSDKDIQKAVKEAEAHAEEDKKIKEKIEIHNNADSVVYTTEKMLSEYSDKMPKELKAKIEEHIKSLKDAIEKDNTDEMKKIMETLEKELQEIGKNIYQNVGQKPGAEQHEGEESQHQSKGGNGKTVDADFEKKED